MSANPRSPFTPDAAGLLAWARHVRVVHDGWDLKKLVESLERQAAKCLPSFEPGSLTKIATDWNPCCFFKNNRHRECTQLWERIVERFAEMVTGVPA